MQRQNIKMGGFLLIKLVTTFIQSDINQQRHFIMGMPLLQFLTGKN